MPLSPLEYLRHMLDEAEYLMSEREAATQTAIVQHITVGADA